MCDPDARVDIGSYTDGRCGACGRAFTRGAGVISPAGELIVSLCQWCLLELVDDITGFGVTAQVLDWYRRKNWFRRRKELGWTRRHKR